MDNSHIFLISLLHAVYDTRHKKNQPELFNDCVNIRSWINPTEDHCCLDAKRRSSPLSRRRELTHCGLDAGKRNSRHFGESRSSYCEYIDYFHSVRNTLVFSKDQYPNSILIDQLSIINICFNMLL